LRLLLTINNAYSKGHLPLTQRENEVAEGRSAFGSQAPATW